MQPAILGVVYDDGFLADKVIARIGYHLRDIGLEIAGLVQRNIAVPRRVKCDMELEELASGKILKVSMDRGAGARGCRLDRIALVEAAMLLAQALEAKPDILVLNKFGRVEAEGGGLRDVLSAAVQLNIPIVVGIPLRNVDEWRSFTGHSASECPADFDVVRNWLEHHILLKNKDKCVRVNLPAYARN